MGSVNSYVNKLYNNFFQINTKYYPPPNAPPEELNFQYNDEETTSIARSDSDLSSDEKKDDFNPLDYAKPVNYLIPKMIVNDFRKIIHKYIVYVCIYLFIEIIRHHYGRYLMILIRIMMVNYHLMNIVLCLEMLGY